MSYWPAYMAIQNLSLVFANTILGEWLGSPWQMHKGEPSFYTEPFLHSVAGPWLLLYCLEQSTYWLSGFCLLRLSPLANRESGFWLDLFICLSILAGHTSGVTGFWTYLFPSREPGCLTEFFAYSRIFIYLLYRQCPGFLLFTVRGRGESA